MVGGGCLMLLLLKFSMLCLATCFNVSVEIEVILYGWLYRNVADVFFMMLGSMLRVNKNPGDELHG